ncbi:LIC_10190 family membrane protein [Moorena producens]|uniref:LIC_10190 family membrane protein n=2 Tax=Moorena TaxID=1155738 RepID=UPI003C71A2F2
MFYFITTWNFLLIPCYLIGTAVLNVLQADSFKRVSDRIIAAVWLGIVVLSIALLATSLVFPLNSWVGWCTAASLSLLSLTSQPTRDEITNLFFMVFPNLALGLLTLEFGVAAFTSRQVTWLDTGLYHYGAIRWLSEYGAVPGIALLLQQLGFTSSWFALAAPFNPPIFDAQVSAITNGFAFLLAIVHFLIALPQLFTNQAQLSDWFIVICSLILLPLLALSSLMSDILVSPSPDIPVILLTVIIAWAMLIIAHHRSSSVTQDENYSFKNKFNNKFYDQFIPLILAAGAVTIKLTCLPILLISVIFYSVFSRFCIKRLVIGAVITSLLLSPMFAVNIVTSGCPLFPSSFLCLDLPWSWTAEEAKAVAENTQVWGIWFDSAPPNIPPWLWLFGIWLINSTLNQIATVIILISIFLTISILRTSINHRLWSLMWVLGLAISGTVFLMLYAPVIRFGIGYIILIPGLYITIIFNKKFGNFNFLITKKIQPSKLWIIPLVFRIISYLALAVITLAIVLNQKTSYRLILPPQMMTSYLVKKQVNGINYFSPQDISPEEHELCWSAKLPCAFELEDNIQLRDPNRGIKGGFIKVKREQGVGSRE